MLVLGAIFVGIAVVSDGTWALAAGTARAWIARSPRRLELIGGAGGRSATLHPAAPTPEPLPFAEPGQDPVQLIVLSLDSEAVRAGMRW